MTEDRPSKCHTISSFNHHLIFCTSNTSCNVIAHVRDFYATAERGHPGTGPTCSSHKSIRRSQSDWSDQVAASFSFLSSNQLSLSLCCLLCLSSPPQVSCDRSYFQDECFHWQSSASGNQTERHQERVASAPTPVVTVHLSIAFSFTLLFAHSSSSGSCHSFILLCDAFRDISVNYRVSAEEHLRNRDFLHETALFSFNYCVCVFWRGGDL